MPGERFYVQLLHTWANDFSLNDLAIAKENAKGRAKAKPKTK
jgi:hypothetical protein